MGRKRSVRGFTDTSSARLRLPDVTGDAAARYERLSHGGSTWHDLMPSPANGTDSTPIVAAITGGPGVGITQANPGVVTATAHGLPDGMPVLISGVAGMTQVNDTLFTVTNKTANTFELYTAGNTPAAVNTSVPPYTAYTSGGTASHGAFTWPAFDGTSSVSLGAPAKLDFADAFTLCIWMNMDMVTPPIQGNEAVLYKGGLGDPGAQNLFVIINDTNGIITSAIYKPGYTSVTSGAGYGGAWHYLTMVNEGVGNDLTLFIDGALLQTTAGGGGSNTWTGTVPWTFGRTDAQGAATIYKDMFQGSIDTGRFYGRALSADEILRDYRAGLAAH